MTAFVLKILAMLSMLVDHCSQLFSWPGFTWFIGRIAFPLYALMLVDSCRHLRSRPERIRKYLITLAILAVVSEFPFDFLYSGQWIYWGLQNQILQFLVYALAAVAADRLRRPWLRVLLWLFVIALNQYCALGYYGMGVVAMLAMKWYLDRREGWRLPAKIAGAVGVAAVVWLGSVVQEMISYVRYYGWRVLSLRLFAGSARLYAVTLVTALFLLLYNGKYGDPPKWFRVVYRYFYPAHLYILTAVVFLLGAG